MQFLNAYREDAFARVLFALLAEREPHQNISHRKMPTFEEHLQFIRSDPYPTWMVMFDDQETPPAFVGAFYVTEKNEVGIFIFKACRGKGYGTRAMEWIRSAYLGQKLLANINPANHDSIKFFTKHGGVLLQHTYTI